jgi:REP element-mobilizing transposase RayT
MTAPRQVLPGSYVFVTRRTTQRKFLLKPSKKANQAFRYCLALAARKTGVAVLWAMVMSNHYHLGLHDPDGRVPDFMRELNRLVSKHHNAMYGRFENLFSSEKYSMVRLEAFEDVLAKLLYSLANPCEDHLVDGARQWPGVISLPGALGRADRVKRPRIFFRANGSLPEEIELHYAVPDCCPWDPDTYRARVTELLSVLEAKARKKRRDSGRKVLGRRQILRQSHEDSPSSPARRFKLNPRIAARDRWRRLEAIQRLKAFLVDHARALASWCAGDRTVEFPPGTYWMRVHHGARVAAAPG